MPTEYEIKIKNSYLIAFGREPSNLEMKYWKSHVATSDADTIAGSHINWLFTHPSNDNLKAREELNSLINRTYTVVVKRTANIDELRYWTKNIKEHKFTYKDLIIFHKLYFSYNKVFGRDANDGERTYWLDSKKELLYSTPLESILSWHIDWLTSTKGVNEIFDVIIWDCEI